MTTSHAGKRLATARDLHFISNPRLWPAYPFLPLTRRVGAEHTRQCGVMYDARGVSGRHGFAATVFLCNLFLLPRTEPALLNGPRVVYDTPEEVIADGWRVD